MLELKQITKTYQSETETATALEDINLTFGDTGFVSILGASGSGKTTLLNIIGGLDHYTSGDLIIDGTSTEHFTDKDWDSYRNGSVGFVFQSYNLISHLNILENVKMSLTLSGISSKKAEHQAKKALKKVGLSKHLKKRPNQLSGGQMQRVAIARALVNDPQILLADEPTGALDTKTSIQIMKLIKKISKKRLVIMVTHNPELAEQYSTRIIEVRDGHIIKDSDPLNSHELQSKEGYKRIKVSMSFWSAIKSSLNNLLTKKGRTSLVTVAGSIGIISIGLVLSLSAGMKSYIDTMQEDTLAGTPITISSEQISFIPTEPPIKELNKQSTKDKQSDETISIKKENAPHQNIYDEKILKDQGTFIDYLQKKAKPYYSSMILKSGYQLKALTKNNKDEIQMVQENNQNSDLPFNPINAMKAASSATLFSEIPTEKQLVLSQYDILHTTDNHDFPVKEDEIAVVLNADGTIDSSLINALGLSDKEQVKISDLLGKQLSVVDNDHYYSETPEKLFFTIQSPNEEIYDTGTKATITTVFVPKETTSSLLGTPFVYTHALAKKMIDLDEQSKIVQVQKEHPDIDLLSPTNDKISDTVYEQTLQKLGGSQVPTDIAIYPLTFDDRNKVTDIIKDYNHLIEKKFGKDSKESETYAIQYSDMAKTMTEIMTTMIDTISIILTAFAAISLVVSSVMIGILTYVSVVERTKEIGIMRALGARKKDITRIFNAEAGLIGLFSGIFGVVVASLLSSPINSIIGKLLDINGFDAHLSIQNLVVLVCLSTILTLLAGFIPSKTAAKMDPVKALRTE